VDKKWRGEIIKRGSFITSLANLSEETGLTVQQTRSTLNKLISTHEITKQTTPHYTRITVNNYDEYQTNNKPNNKQATNKQQTSNKQVTTTIEYIEGIEGVEYIDKDLLSLVELYNNLFQKNVRSYKGFEANYQYWKDIHSLDKMKIALQNARLDKFWKNKMTLTILFRRKNTRGENVDYIEDLSQRVQSSSGMVAII